ncbi:MAG: hypothetical protein AAGI49_11595 [Bacteroidota bacterium]
MGSKKKKSHRVRIQAQGGKEQIEKSVSLNKDEPITKEEGLSLLEELKGMLSKNEKEQREKQLEAAKRFIENAEGVDAPLKIPFRNRKTKDTRIDIEVNAGTAFVCMMLIVLVYFLLAG